MRNSWPIAVTFFLCACGPQIPKSKVRKDWNKPLAHTPPITATFDVDDDDEDDEDYRSPKHKRDPFQPPESVKPAVVEKKEALPPAVKLKGLRLVFTNPSANPPSALAVDDRGVTHVLNVGDAIGEERLRIEQVRDGWLVLGTGERGGLVGAMRMERAAFSGEY